MATVEKGIVDIAGLRKRYGAKLTLRVSLDHWRADLHHEERGEGSFDETLVGLRWLRDEGIALAIAGRLRWSDEEADMREGYAALFSREGLRIDANDHGALVGLREHSCHVEHVLCFQPEIELFDDRLREQLHQRGRVRERRLDARPRERRRQTANPVVVVS